MLLCLVVCLTLLASFFLPSSSLIKWMAIYIISASLCYTAWRLTSIISGSVSKVVFEVGDLAFFFSTLAFSFASCFSLSCMHHREMGGRGEEGEGRGEGGGGGGEGGGGGGGEGEKRGTKESNTVEEI